MPLLQQSRSVILQRKRRRKNNFQNRTHKPTGPNSVSLSGFGFKNNEGDENCTNSSVREHFVLITLMIRRRPT